MENPNIIDCYKLDLTKDIPLEFDLLTEQRDQLIIENQKLKKIILALGIGVSCVIIYKIINTYGKKQKNTKEKTFSKKPISSSGKNRSKHRYHYKNGNTK